MQRLLALPFASTCLDAWTIVPAMPCASTSPAARVSSMQETRGSRLHTRAMPVAGHKRRRGHLPRMRVKSPRSSGEQAPKSADTRMETHCKELFLSARKLRLLILETKSGGIEVACLMARVAMCYCPPSLRSPYIVVAVTHAYVLSVRTCGVCCLFTVIEYIYRGCSHAPRCQGMHACVESMS